MEKTKEEIIEEFKANTIEEYERDKRLHNYCNLQFVDETDGNFIQIGIRPQIDKELFDPKASIHRGIFGLGRNISLGEERYFVDNILNNINSETRKVQEVTLPFLTEKAERLNGTREDLIMLVPISHEYENLLKRRMISYDNLLNAYIFNAGTKKIKVYGISDKFINDNIILFNRSAITWKYKKFSNGQRLDIQINKPKKDEDKYDVIVRVLIKQEINPEFIKVIKLIK